MHIIHFYVNLFIESEALVMTGDVVVVLLLLLFCAVLWFNVPVNIYGHVETVS